MVTYTVRPARPTDGPELLGLIEELARFERLAPPEEAARERLLRDAFGPEPLLEVFVAEVAGVSGLVGYAIALRTYSSFLAKPTLFLEDLYLSPAHRGTGLARHMMGALARIALDRGWGRLEGIVLTWNERARRFYRATGGQELEEWKFFRYDEAALAALAAPTAIRRANP